MSEGAGYVVLTWGQASHFQPMIDPYEAGKRIRVEAGVEGQVILDALVDAGLLEPMNAATGGDWESWWRIPKPKPHVHIPRFTGWDDAGRAEFECKCGESSLPLPIEWPDDE
jgi:hypothetical protein